VQSGTTPVGDVDVVVPTPLAVGTYHWRVRSVGDETVLCSSGWLCGCPFTIGSPLCDGLAVSGGILPPGTTFWTLADSPVIVNGIVSVSGGATLDVAAGVMVKLEPAAAIDVQSGGSLVTHGTATDPVVFTSIRDDSACGPSSGGSGTPAPGDWVGITFEPGSTGSFSRSILRYARNGLTIDTATNDSVSVVDSAIEDCLDTSMSGSNAGLAVRGSSTPTFTNLTLLRSRFLVEGNSRPTFVGGTWTGGMSAPTPGLVRYNSPSMGDTPDPTFTGAITLTPMSFASHDAVDIDTGALPIVGTTHWKGVPFWISYPITIGSLPSTAGHVGVTNATVFFDPYAYSQNAGIDVQVGSLDLGSATESALLTAGGTMTSPGQWAGIRYSAAGGGNVRNTTFRYARNALTIDTTIDDSVSVVDSAIEDCLDTSMSGSNAGLDIRGTSKTTLTNLTLLRSRFLVEGSSRPTFAGGTWTGGMSAPTPGLVRYNSPSMGDTPDPIFSGTITLTPMSFSSHDAVDIDTGALPIVGTTHWKGVPFWISYPITIGSVPSTAGHVGVTNATVFFDPYAYSQNAGIEVQVGSLDLGSVTESALLTAGGTMTSPGQWEGVRYSAAGGGTVRNATFRYAKNGLTIDTAIDDSVSVVDSAIEDCLDTSMYGSNAGLDIRGTSKTTLTNLTLLRSRFLIEGNSRPTFVGGTWTGGMSAPTPGLVRYNSPSMGDTPDPTFSGTITLTPMSFSSHDAVDIDTGALPIIGTTHWKGVPFWISYPITIGSVPSTAGHVGISSATVFFDPYAYSQNAGIDVQVGSLDLGSATESALLTAGGTMTSPGQWEGVRYSAAGGGSVRNTTFRYAKNGLTIDTTIDDSVSVVETSLEDCYDTYTGGTQAGLDVRGISKLTFTNLTLLHSRFLVEGNSRPTFVGGTWTGGFTAESPGVIRYNWPSPGNTPDPVFAGTITLTAGSFLSHDAVDIDTGTLPIVGTTHWKGIPFWISYPITIGSIPSTAGHVGVTNATVFFDPYAYPQSAGIDVQVGSLDLGSATESALLTAGGTMTSPGQWEGVRYSAGGSGTIRNATIHRASAAIRSATALPLSVVSSELTGDSDAVIVETGGTIDLGGGSTGSTGGNIIAGQPDQSPPNHFSVDNQGTSPISARWNNWGCASTLEMELGTNVTLIRDAADPPYSSAAVDYSEWIGNASRVVTMSKAAGTPPHDLVLTWAAEFGQSFRVKRGTDPTSLVDIGPATGTSWIAVGELDDHSSPLVIWSIDCAP
jgi:hypothetical protein